jgi:hypothetical protein
MAPLTDARAAATWEAGDVELTGDVDSDGDGDGDGDGDVDGMDFRPNMYSGWETVSRASKSGDGTGYIMTISLLMKDRKWRVAAVKLSVIEG